MELVFIDVNKEETYVSEGVDYYIDVCECVQLRRIIWQISTLTFELCKIRVYICLDARS